MASLAIPTAQSRPLSDLQQQEIATAHDRARTIRKAAAVAGCNVWMTGIAAVCSAPFALFSLSGLVVTAGLSWVAYNELQGRRRLLQFDPEAPAFLGWNQVGFLLFITAYCIWMLVAGLTSESPIATELKANPELIAALGSMDELDQTYKLLVVGVYGTVLAISVVFQGLTAFYYFTRRKSVEAYVQNTPAWVLDLQQLTSLS